MSEIKLKVRVLEAQVERLNRDNEVFVKKLKHLELLNLAKDARIKVVEDGIKGLADIMTNMQPILGRLIAAVVVLENKGIVNANELTAISEKAAENFAVTANPKLVEPLCDQSQQAGTVEVDHGDSGCGVSGDESVGGTPASDSMPQDGERSRIIRLSDVRAAHDSINRTSDVGTSKEKDVPAE